jgi:hypothetical protein
VGSGTVTLDCQFASPVTLSGDTNVFIFMFDYKNPVLIDLAASTVTYNAAGPGTDLTVTNPSCTTDHGEFCGSGTPGTGISFNLAIVPEPVRCRSCSPRSAACQVCGNTADASAVSFEGVVGTAESIADAGTRHQSGESCASRDPMGRWRAAGAA